MQIDRRQRNEGCTERELTEMVTVNVKVEGS